VVEEAEGEGRVGEDVYEVFQVQAHAQLKEAVLLQLMALQSTPAMIGARTLPGLTAPLLQHMTLQATPGNDCGTHPAVADGTFAVADDAASNADAVVADVLVGVSTLAAAGDAASDADTVVADASVGISTLAAAGDAASDADTVVAEALVGVSTLAAAGDAASDADTVVDDASVGISMLAAAGDAAGDANTVQNQWVSHSHQPHGLDTDFKFPEAEPQSAFKSKPMALYDQAKGTRVHFDRNSWSRGV
jgi:hypothetical protein